MKDLDSNKLDRYITGNYGEGMYPEDDWVEVEPPLSKCKTCGQMEDCCNDECEACHYIRQEEERQEENAALVICAECSLVVDNREDPCIHCGAPDITNIGCDACDDNFGGSLTSQVDINDEVLVSICQRCSSDIHYV